MVDVDEVVTAPVVEIEVVSAAAVVVSGIESIDETGLVCSKGMTATGEVVLGSDAEVSA